jgi:bifunctional non-homologous end joining protein LigD
MPSPAEGIEVSRPDKMLWPSRGITKRRYVDYLDAMSERMLPWLRGRPVTLIRAPDGVGGKRYFQKAVSSYAPEWIRTVRIPAPSAGRDVDFVVCDDRATLLWLGNQASLEFHLAPVRADRLDRPDLLVVEVMPENLARNNPWLSEHVIRQLTWSDLPAYLPIVNQSLARREFEIRFHPPNRAW